MLEKCVLTVLELIWNQRLGHKTKLNICHHILTSSTQLQNRSFHVVERTRTSSKCQKMKYARAKRAKILFFTVKYANLWDFCCRRCLSSLLARYVNWRSLFRFLNFNSFTYVSMEICPQSAIGCCRPLADWKHDVSIYVCYVDLCQIFR